MPTTRKRRPQSFDLSPAPDSEAAPSGWTYRSETGEKGLVHVERKGEAGSPPPLARSASALDWATWPVKFALVLLFAPFGGARRRP